MYVEDNKSLARRFWLEAFNNMDIEMIDELFAPDHVLHHQYLSDESHGADFMKIFVWLSHKISPDLEVAIEDEVAEGEKVVTRWTARGTLAYRPEVADDDKVVVSGISIFYAANGKIKETLLMLEPQLDESQRPVPNEHFHQWLVEDDRSMIEAHSPGPPDDLPIPPVALAICCMWNRRCC